MTEQRNAWIIFCIGLLVLAIEFIFPDTVKEVSLEVVNGISVVGTIGFTLTILSVLRLLNILPSFDTKKESS